MGSDQNSQSSCEEITDVQALDVGLQIEDSSSSGGESSDGEAAAACSTRAACDAALASGARSSYVGTSACSNQPDAGQEEQALIDAAPPGSGSALLDEGPDCVEIRLADDEEVQERAALSKTSPVGSPRSASQGSEGTFTQEPKRPSTKTQLEAELDVEFMPLLEPEAAPGPPAPGPPPPEQEPPQPPPQEPAPAAREPAARPPEAPAQAPEPEGQGEPQRPGQQPLPETAQPFEMPSLPPASSSEAAKSPGPVEEIAFTVLSEVDTDGLEEPAAEPPAPPTPVAPKAAPPAGGGTARSSAPPAVAPAAAAAQAQSLAEPMTLPPPPQPAPAVANVGSARRPSVPRTSLRAVTFQEPMAETSQIQDDEAIARQLQEEEDRQQARPPAQPPAAAAAAANGGAPRPSVAPVAAAGARPDLLSLMHTAVRSVEANEPFSAAAASRQSLQQARAAGAYQDSGSRADSVPVQDDLDTPTAGSSDFLPMPAATPSGSDSPTSPHGFRCCRRHRREPER